METVSMTYRKPVRIDPDADVHLPAWGELIEGAIAQKWGVPLNQIPATVIDQGVFKNVPYLSFRCGTDYEINIYGDPENPSGIEIGCYRDLLKDPEAKENCISLISSLLKRDDLMVAVKYANRNKDLLAVKEWLIEISPPEEPDSYGGWWVCIYAPKTLETQRASDQEIEKLSVSRSEITEKREETSGWSKRDLQSARPSPPVTPSTTPEPVRTQARPAVSPVVTSAFPASGNAPLSGSATLGSYAGPTGGGRVYVSGYTRQNGTYVHSYTRRR